MTLWAELAEGEHVDVRREGWHLHLTVVSGEQVDVRREGWHLHLTVVSGEQVEREQLSRLAVKYCAEDLVAVRLRAMLQRARTSTKTAAQP